MKAYESDWALNQDLLGAALIDAITERVAAPERAADRAAVIAQLVACAADAVHWRLEPRGDPREEDGVRSILTAAIAHQAAMAGDHHT